MKTAFRMKTNNGEKSVDITVELGHRKGLLTRNEAIERKDTWIDKIHEVLREMNWNCREIKLARRRR